MSSIWSIATAYAVEDVVTYNDSLYVCVVANTGYNPALSPSKWAPQTTPVDWVATRNYLPGDRVSASDGNDYVATEANTNHEPPSASYWQVIGASPATPDSGTTSDVVLHSAAGTALLGQKTKAGSIPVTMASDEDLLARQGALTETAPANDTASSGLNGRLQRVAQNLSSILATAGAAADAIVAAGAAGSLSAKLRRVTQGLEDLKTLIVLAASEAHIGAVGGQTVSVNVEVTRPNDSNPYIAKDVFDLASPAGFVFNGMARLTGGSGYIVKAQLMTDQKTNTARFRLHLFNAVPTYIADNAPYLKLYTNMASRVGEIDFVANSTEDSTNSTAAGAQLTSGSGNLPLPFVCDADAKLYGILEIIDAFTPAANQKISIKLTADQN